MNRWEKPFEENLRLDRPNLYRKLSESGQLKSYLTEISSLTMKASVQLSKRMNPFQAESEAVRMFLLPSEEDRQNLGEGPLVDTFEDD